MANMAYAEINGVLVANPKLTNTDKGSIAKFYVEVVRDNTGAKDKFNMTAWNQIAENCADYLQKGSHVKTKCKVETKPFADGKFYVTEFVVNHIEFLDKEEIADGQM